MELEKIHLLAQLIDNIEKMALKIEKAYRENNSEDFIKSKKAMLDFQEKISNILK